MSMNVNYSRKLVLEDGSVYKGFGFGSSSEKILEIVFNTSVVGYQEIISDPSYTYQGVVMSYPLIGNYGMAGEDYETKTPTIGALIVRDYNDRPSNFRAEKSLSEVMKVYDIPGISGIDTRKLVRSIRDAGSRLGIITDINTPEEEAIEKIKNYPVPHDAVSFVSRKASEQVLSSKTDAEENHKPYKVVAIDCGMKENIVRCLSRYGCDVTILPFDTDYKAIEEINPDGVFLSNGPGDPTDVIPVIELVKNIRGRYPIFGICLGHQIISLAYGAQTYKLKFGHRGGNHPVMNLETGKIEITSQNHSFAVDEESLKATSLKVTHVNILDKTIEGVECVEDKVFCVQYHPESAPGPQDSMYLFEKFLKIMEENKNA